MSANRRRMDVPATVGAGTSGRPGWGGSPFQVPGYTCRDGLSFASVLSNPPEMGPTTRQETSRCQYVSHPIDVDLVAGRQHIGRRQSQPRSLDSVTRWLTNG